MIMNISCNERCDPYFGYMNAEASENYNMRLRYLYKIYQVGVSPLYTTDERKAVVRRLLANASEQNDENNRALDLICAFKIVQYNGFDMNVPRFRVSETLWTNDIFPKKELPEVILKGMSGERRNKSLAFLEHFDSNEEILNLYNVAIQRDWYASFNPMKTEVDDGLYDGMDGMEAFNRRNNNAVKCIVISLLYSKRCAKNIEYFRLSFEDGKPNLFHKEIKDIPDLNLLEDSGKNSIEYYWIVFNSSPELFDQNCEIDIDDVATKKYKIALFYKDFDHSSGNLHVLPGAMQVWEKEEGINEEGFWIRNGEVNQKYYEKTPGCKCEGGQVYAEDGWSPVAVTDKRGKEGKKTKNHYIFWYSWGDLITYIRYAIGKADFESLKINKECRAGTRGNSKRFNDILNEKQYEGLGFHGRDGGTCTYDILKFKEIDGVISCGYRVVYMKDEGYFYIFDGKVTPYKKGRIKNLLGKEIADTQSPNDFIVAEDNKGYWKLNYSKGIGEA